MPSTRFDGHDLNYTKYSFTSGLDGIVVKLKGVWLVVITSYVILYMFAVVTFLYFQYTLEVKEPDTSLTDRYGDGYVVPMVISFLFLFYWTNKVLLAFVFWTLILLFLAMVWMVYSLIYC